MQGLTSRENEIFKMLLSGFVPKVIANSLNISYETVLYHQKKLYSKLEVHSINELLSKYSPDLFVFKFNEKTTVPNPVVINFIDDGPQGTGRQFIIDRDLFFYNGEWRKSPYRLNKKERITAGDLYDISCTFISDTDFGYLEAGFFDALAGGKEGNYWTLLSDYLNIFNRIKAGIEYSASLSLNITKTATCGADIANRFLLIAGPKTEKNPTLTFTNLEITKH